MAFIGMAGSGPSAGLSVANAIDVPSAESEARVNDRRLEAAEVLLKEDLFDEAEKVLATVNGDVDSNRQSAISGYLLAKRGRCEEANQLFAKVECETGDTCVPDSYRAACAK
jgi:predicted negative regulator of RcsB-dependent stress response